MIPFPFQQNLHAKCTLNNRFSHKFTSHVSFLAIFSHNGLILPLSSVTHKPFATLSKGLSPEVESEILRSFFLTMQSVT